MVATVPPEQKRDDIAERVRIADLLDNVGQPLFVSPVDNDVCALPREGFRGRLSETAARGRNQRDGTVQSEIHALPCR